MEVIAIEYKENAKGEIIYGYKFLHEGKSYDYLFRNFGRVCESGVRNTESPEGVLQWFKDIEGDDGAIATSYDLKRAILAVETCNKKLGCSATCDFGEKQKCELLAEQTLRQQEMALTKEFMSFVLESGFIYMSQDAYRSKYKKGK